MLAQNLAPLVVGEIRAHYWQTDDRLVIRQRTEGGSEYRLVDAQAQSNEPLFDSARLAELLSATTGTEVDADLALRDIKLDAQTLSFVYDATRYELDLQSYLAQAGALRELAQPPKHEFLSPDGKQAAFIRDHNLWLRSTEDNSETQLTQDGARNYGYATNSAGWIQDPGPVLLWSPDSKKIATFRQDSRNVGTISLMETAVGAGRGHDVEISTAGRRARVHAGAFGHSCRRRAASRLSRNAAGASALDNNRSHCGRDGEFLDVRWGDDSETLAFVSSSRDHKIAQLRSADINTGAVRDVYREQTATYYESGFDSENWTLLNASNEFLWFSERDNWGHLYLGDLASGEIKRQITEGSCAVLQLLEVDEAAREVTFIGSNREGR
jgi:translation elongation factor P/translation initiation factor 5A